MADVDVWAGVDAAVAVDREAGGGRGAEVGDDVELRPAFYAAGRGPWRDWWTVLHPPYTAWHLSYVVMGAALAPTVRTDRLVATVLAFFLAVGIAAHALDEVKGRPLRTAIPDWELWAAGVLGVGGAVALGIVGLARIGPWLLAFIVVGPVLVAGYNLELFGGRLHTDVGFAAAWGAFPLLVGYFAEAGTLDGVAAVGAVAAFALSWGQRALSTPARNVRRKVRHVEGSITMADGRTVAIDARVLLRPIERALHGLALGVVAIATAMALSRLT